MTYINIIVVISVGGVPRPDHELEAVLQGSVLLNINKCIYIYIYTVCVYIYIYIYIYTL